MLTGRSVRARHLGTPFGDPFELRAGPSPYSADVGNSARRRHRIGYLPRVRQDQTREVIHTNLNRRL